MSLENQRAFSAGAKHGRSNSSPKVLSKGNPLPRLPTLPATKSPPGPRLDKDGPASGLYHEAKENTATPVNGILSPNITPRSESRKARVGSASPTPSVLPKVARLPAKSTDVRQRSSADTASIAGFNPSDFVNGGKVQGDRLSGNILSSPRESPLGERDSSVTTRSMGLGSPQFFHADDVHETLSSMPQPSKKVLDPRSPDLSRLVGTRDTTNSAVSRSDLSRAGQSPKFFYANDASDQHSATPQSPAIGSASNLPPQPMYSPVLVPSPPRAPSPLKEVMRSRRSSGSQPTVRQLGRLSSHDGTDFKGHETVTAGSRKVSRPSSLMSSRKPSLSEQVRSSGLGLSGPASLSNAGPIQGSQTTGLSDRNEMPPILRSPTSEAKTELPAAPILSPGPQSPTKSQNTVDQINDYAANARRERKVLDLEISNSSLLAINRTLEREMRKQTAELRRLRRLTQSSRFSAALSARSTSGSLLGNGDIENEPDFDDLLSPSESDDDRPDDSLSNRSSTGASSLSSSLPGHGTGSRFQDPKREPLDLSAQKALLLESRRLNESINRCLNQTDTLIKAGKEALERCVQASELETLGFKVLTSDENDDDSFIEHGKGLLSPFISSDQGVNPWENTLNGFMNDISVPSINEVPNLDAESDSELPRRKNEGQTFQSAVGDEIEAAVTLSSPSNRKRDEAAIAQPHFSDSPLSTKDPDQATNAPSASVNSLDAKVHNVASNDSGLADCGQSETHTAVHEEPESYEPSIDGLDEDAHASQSEGPKTPPPNQFFARTTSPARRTGDSQGSNPSSPQRQNMNAAANTPGNRSSMKTLGQFFGLESMSILGMKGT